MSKDTTWRGDGWLADELAGARVSLAELAEFSGVSLSTLRRIRRGCRAHRRTFLRLASALAAYRYLTAPERETDRREPALHALERRVDELEHARSFDRLFEAEPRPNGVAGAVR